MNKKLVILSTALFFLFRAYPVKSKETISNECTADSTNKETSLQFLLTHPEKCTSCNIDFSIRNESNTTDNPWYPIKIAFGNLIALCNSCETNKNDNEWAELIGLNFPAIIKITAQPANGIHGDLSLTADDTNCGLTGNIYHDQDYDHEAWQSIIHLLANYASEETIKKNSPFIANILEIAQQSEGIHGSLELKLNN